MQDHSLQVNSKIQTYPSLAELHTASFSCDYIVFHDQNTQKPWKWWKPKHAQFVYFSVIGKQVWNSANVTENKIIKHWTSAYVAQILRSILLKL